MKLRSIYFYIILLLLALDIDSSTVRSRPRSQSKLSKVNKRKRKKPTKGQKKRVNQVLKKYNKPLKNPVSETNTLEKKKEAIKTLLATILKNSPRMEGDRSRIAKAIANEKFLGENISLNENDDMIDTKSGQTILTKAEIEKLDIDTEITKETIKDIIEKTETEIIEASNGILKKENGNIVDSTSNIIISKESIDKAINNIKNQNPEKIKALFKPAAEYLKKKEPNNKKKIEQIIERNTNEIPKKVVGNLSRERFPDINITRIEGETKGSNNFILNLELEQQNYLELIMNGIVFFQPFNDGIIDVFGMLYQFDNKDFKTQNGDITFNEIVVLKRFIVEQDKTYKNIKIYIENYWREYNELIRNSMEKESSKNENELKDIFGKEVIKTLSNNKINSIMKIISDEIELLSFDKKLKRILLYIYGALLYYKTELKHQNTDLNNLFYTNFKALLLDKTKIIEEANTVFSDKIFNDLINNKISLTFNDIKTIFENKFTENDYNYFIMHNPEFQLLLLFNLILNLSTSEINFESLDWDDQLKNILKSQENYSVEKEEQEVDKRKDELLKYIKEKYTENNIARINKYLDTNEQISNTIKNKKQPPILYIPHFTEFDKTSKKEYLNFFEINRYINIYQTIDHIPKKELNSKQYINLFTYYYDTSKTASNNQLYTKLFTPIRSREEAIKDERIEHKEDQEPKKKIYEYSTDRAVEYIAEIGKSANSNNENSDILKLINILINTINLDYFFIQLNNELDELQKKSPEKNEEQYNILKKYYEYLTEVNKLFLDYLRSIYNLLIKKRCYIRNYDETASKKAWRDFKQEIIAPAIIGGIGTVGYAIGLENLTTAAETVVGGGIYAAKLIGNFIKEYPKATLVFAGLGTAAGLGYDWVNRKKQQYKERPKQSNIIASPSIQLETLE